MSSSGSTMYQLTAAIEDRKMSLKKTGPVGLIAALLALVICADGSRGSDIIPTDLDLQQAYGELDAYLTKNVKADDAATNFAAAHRMLDEAAAGDAQIVSLMRAIKTFTSLEKIESEHKCDSESHQILLDNIRASGRDLTSKQDLRQVDRIVREFCVKLAKHCLHVYPAKFQTKFDELDGEDSQLVDDLDRWFLKDIYAYRFGLDSSRKNYPISHRSFLQKTDSIGGKRETEIAIRALEFYAMSEPDRKYLTSECDAIERHDKVRELFERYLVEPCHEYVNLLGPGIFSLANFDAQFHIKPGMTHSYDAEQSFYQAWARFRFCDALIKQKQELLRQIFENLEEDC